MLSSDHDGIIICGKRKRGKSTLTRQLYSNEKRVCLYDAKGELKEPLQLRFGTFVPRIWEDKGILRVSVIRENAPQEELEWSAYLAQLMGHCVYVVDELADALLGDDPGENWMWVTRLGRKHNIRFMYTFQRAAEVPTMARAQAQDWYLFQTNEGNDTDYIRKSVSKQASEQVRTLTRGQALHVRDGDVVGVVETEKPFHIVIEGGMPRAVPNV